MRRRIVDDDGLLGILSSNFLSVQKWIGGCCYCSRRGIFLHLLSLSSRVNLMHFLAARPNRLLLPNCSELPNFCYCRWLLLLRIIKIATAQQVQLFHFIKGAENVYKIQNIWVFALKINLICHQKSGEFFLSISITQGLM